LIQAYGRYPALSRFLVHCGFEKKKKGRLNHVYGTVFYFSKLPKCLPCFDKLDNLITPSIDMALRLLASRSAIRTTQTQRLFSTASVLSSSHGLNRLKEHYHNLVADDLMVLTYDHSKVAPPTLKNADLESLLNNALSESVEKTSIAAPKVEEIRKRKGGKPLKPIAPLKNGSNIPVLDKITVHAMVKDAIHSKNHILSAFMAIQSITATRPEVIFAKTSVANWKLR
jgi:ribosomal protein L5